MLGMVYHLVSYGFLDDTGTDIENLLDGCAQILELIGLSQKCLGCFGMIAGHDPLLVVPTGKNHRNVG
jgi:hypothetical protein